MKKVKMMYLKHCPHCKKAFGLIEELKTKYPQFQNVQIEAIEENEKEEKTKGYDYWYVPTYFVDDVKMHEGIPDEEALLKVLKASL